MILFANYFFYANWSLTLLALIPAASSIDYVLGLGLQYSKNRSSAGCWSPPASS